MGALQVRRVGTGRRAASAAGDAARLRLLEEYLDQHDDLTACAHASVEWLAGHAGVDRAVCLAVDADATLLIGVAGVGVARDAVERFSRPLADERDPLVAALRQAASTTFGRRRAGGSSGDIPSTPFGASPFTAIPLRAGHGSDEPATGLLLLRPSAQAAPDVRWLVGVLGRRIGQVRGRGSLSEDARRARRERALYFSIINAVTDPVLFTDPEGRLVVTNARAERLLSATEEESEGRRRAVELNTLLLSAVFSRAAVGQPGARELLLVDPSDGSDLFFELLNTTVPDVRGGMGVVSVLRNITDLRRAGEQIEDNYHRLRLAEAAVRVERDRLNLIIDSVADPILVTDPGGATVLMNAPAAELFALTTDADDSAQRLVRANDAHFSSFISGLLLGDGGPDDVRRGEIGLVHPISGTLTPVEAIAGKVLTDAGELTAVVTILHDRREALERAELYEQLKDASVDLQRRVQLATAELATQNELLRRQAIELEQASRLKSQFLANMSHEFRTPLNAILGYTHMLLHGVAGDLSGGVRRQLQRIDSNGRHLLTIINEILDITRIEAGKMPMQVSEFDLNAVVPEVMAELDAVIARSAPLVVPTLAPELPILRSDRQKVKQILVNLLSNALKFTHHGRIDVVIAYDCSAGTATITVADTGIGISPEHHDRIFEDFRQVDDSPSRQYGGTGLGLAICRRLATALGGRIELDSRLDEGSTFTLSIPTDVTA